MWPTFAGGAFRGILLLANGQFKGSRRRCSWVDEGAYWVPTGCQSFVLQCPNYFIDLPSTFVQFGVLHTLRHPRVFQGIHAHPWVDQATTLTSLISGMRGNVAIWQRQRKGLSVFRAKRRHNDDGCSMHIHCPVDMWSTTNVISYCVRQNDDYQNLPQRKIMRAVFAEDLRK